MNKILTTRSQLRYTLESGRRVIFEPPLPPPPFTATTWDGGTEAGINLDVSQLQVTNQLDSNIQGVQAQYPQTSGKFYFEVTIGSLQSSPSYPYYGVGVAVTASLPTTYNKLLLHLAEGGALMFRNAQIDQDAHSGAVYGPAGMPVLATNTVLGIAVNISASAHGSIWIREVNSSNPAGFQWCGSFWSDPAGFQAPAGSPAALGPPQGPLAPAAVFGYGPNDSVTFNFGNQVFSGLVPYGYATGWGNPQAGGVGGVSNSVFATDASWSSVVFLCGFEVSTWDESTVNNKGGGGSITGASGGLAWGGTFTQGQYALILAGTDGLTYANSSNDLIFPTQHFTIECVVNTTTTAAGTAFVMGVWYSGAGRSWRIIRSGSTYQFQVSTTGSDVITVLTGGTITANNWLNLAVDFDGTTYRMYINGPMVASSTTLHTMYSSPYVMSVGYVDGSIGGFTGGIDEIRITKGVARYASNSGYTAPGGNNPFARWVIPVSPVAVLDPAKAKKATIANTSYMTKGTSNDWVLDYQGVMALASSARTSGKYYFELTANTVLDQATCYGVCDTASDFLALAANGTGGVAYHDNDDVFANGSDTGTYVGPFNSGDTIGIAVDVDNLMIWVHGSSGSSMGASWNSDPTANPATNTGGIAFPAGNIVPFMTFGQEPYSLNNWNGGLPGNMYTVNFGASAFVLTPPSGFTHGWPA
jgi:hypothetical protein